MFGLKMRALVVAMGMIAAALGMAPLAGADPSDDPCQLHVTFLCRFLPIAPDLDHNIDLTKDPVDVDGQPLPVLPAGSQPADAPPADLCFNGCA